MIRALVICAGLLACACATDDAAQGGKGKPASPPEPAATPLEVPAVAVQAVDAPGFNVEELTARVRDAVVRGSGASCVDQISVRAELAACTEAPCPDALSARYRDALYVVASSVSRVGDVLLATVRIQRGVAEVARASDEGSDARVAIERAGARAGAALRTQLLADGATERTDASP